jgi:DNA repair photolyase
LYTIGAGNKQIMIVRKIMVKNILSTSKVYDYVVNPYMGCQHACSYCYARFMKRFTGHREPWGEFVDIKINAPDLLRQEIKKKKKGRVWVSGVCDPYQPLETKYKLTRKCLELLIGDNWPITIQTRSPLVLRDIDLLKTANDIEVGMTITTADDSIRQLFEQHATPIKERIKALEELRGAGISTFAMIAPMLPKAEGLPALLKGKVDHILIDRMNYHYGDWVYKKNKLEAAMKDDFFIKTARQISSSCENEGIDCRVLC